MTIPDLFKMFPEEVRRKEAICVVRIEKAGFKALEKLWENIPDELKNSGPVLKKKNLRGGTGSLGVKQASLLSTCGRLLLVAAFVGGLIEVILYAIGKLLGEKTLETHWRRAPDQSWVFAPMSDCLLPPPPSAWISFVMDAGKAGAFTLMFGYINRLLHEDELADWTKRVVFVMASLFQLIIVPVSSALTIYHFITEVYPKQPTVSAGYQCFFLGWNSSFLDFSYLLLMVRAVGTNQILIKLMPLRYRYEYFGGFQQEAVLAPKEQFKALYTTLLSNERLDRPMSNGTVECKKLAVTMNALYITAGIYVLIDIPFTLTHKLPTAIVFAPFLLVLAVTIAIFFYFTRPDGFNDIWNIDISFNLTSGIPRQRTRWSELRRNLIKMSWEIAKLDWEFAERTGYMVFLPVIFFMSMMNLILTYGSVYFYEDTGYVASVALVFAERRADRYGEALFTKITSKAWSAAALIQGPSCTTRIKPHETWFATQTST